MPAFHYRFFFHRAILFSMMSLLITLYIFFFAVLTYRSARLALALLIVLLPSYLLRFTVYGVPFTVLEVSIWTITIVWFITRYREYHGLIFPQPALALSESNPFRLYFFPILLWLLVATVSVIISPNFVSALGIWKAYFVEPLLVFSILVLEFRNRHARWWIFVSLGYAVLIIGVVAWFQKITGAFIPEPYTSNLPLKVTSVFSYPNAVGLFVTPVLALYFTWILFNISNQSRRKHLAYNLLVIIIGAGSIVFSLTKGAWVGVLAGIFVGAMIFLRGWKKVILILIVILSSTLIVVSPDTRGVVFEQINFNSPSGQMRLVVWQETYEMLKNNPVLGAGLAGYQTALQPYHKDWRPDISPYKLEIFLYPHNVFLNFWSELGLAGLIVFVWLLSIFFYTAWQRRHQPFSMAALAAMIALLVHGLVDVPYFKNDLAILFWVIMALPLLEGKSVHIMHFHPDHHIKIASGMKKIEGMVLNKNRRQINVGDILLCYPSRGSYACVRAEVMELTPKLNFEELFDELHPSDFGYENREYGLSVLRDVYSKEDEEENGVVGVRIRLI